MGSNSKIAPDQEHIIFFDGVCNLCNGAVQFIIKRDKSRYFKFASLQSQKAGEILADQGIDPSKMESIILLDKVRVLRKSNAVLEICRHLSGLWPVLYLLTIIPRQIRDLVYDWIADHRYRWFGKRNECMVPNRDLISRFIEA